MIGVMLHVNGDFPATLQAGLDFFNRKYTVSPCILWVHPDWKEVLPDGMSLTIKAEKYVYSPKIIYLGYEENKPERPDNNTRPATTD